MHCNIVLIDFENAQPEALEMLSAKCFKVMLFVGANQSKLPFETAASMQKLGSRAEYVKIAGTGSNALDFHIAFYIGVLSTNDSSATFYIVSNDTGFDPLITHLKSKKIRVNRVASIGEIPKPTAVGGKPAKEQVPTAKVVTPVASQAVKKPVQIVKTTAAEIQPVKKQVQVAKVTAVSAKSPKERVQIIADKLTKSNFPKPRTLKSFGNVIASLFQKQLTKAEISSIIQKLANEGHISVVDTKVTYSAASKPT